MFDVDIEFAHKRKKLVGFLYKITFPGAANTSVKFPGIYRDGLMPLRIGHLVPALTTKTEHGAW